MGLPARQRRVLDRIECALRGSDPRLAALYAIFARLTRDEEMPRIEQLRHRALRFLIRLRTRAAIVAGAVVGRLTPRPRAILFFPLALMLATASIVFAARSSSGPTCSPMTPLAAGPAHPQSKLCKSPDSAIYFGH
jgi:Protein of unknown function (DUF3040)